MNNQYMLALDQGTTSSRAIIFDRSGTPVATAQKEFKQIFPQPGWVEHNAEEIWSSQIGVMAEVLAQAGLDPQQIAGIGITNQRETAVLWNRKSGKPVYPAIVWQDRRTADFCDELKAAGHAGTIRQKTGLVIDSYFSASKLKWMLENVPGAREQAEKGELAFGTIDSWLIWKLTAGRLHITDVTNACRTQLMNIHTGAWDDDLLKLFSIPASVLPEIRTSSEIYGHTELLGPRHPIPIAGIAGDQQAALFGQICTQPGMVKNTYGTGCFMLMHTGEQAVDSKNNLLTTIAWKIGNRPEYALEGSIFIAGAVVQWLRDELRFFRNSSEIESLAASVSDTGGVYLVPAFAGLGAPHWNPHARGAVFGITRGTSKGHIARAALESIAFQTADIVHAMESDSGIAIRELRVDGGATVNNLLMQFQCDLLGVPVIRPKVYETTALGACYLAGLATGYWSSMDEIRKQWETDKRFEPAAPPQEVEKLRKGWRRAVKATMAWADDR